MPYFREEETASPLLKSDCNPVLSGCRVTKSLVFCVVFVSHCLSFRPFLDCIVDTQNVIEHEIILIYFYITFFIRMYSFCYYANYIKLSQIRKDLIKVVSVKFRNVNKFEFRRKTFHQNLKNS
jgi:hypothetical protein